MKTTTWAFVFQKFGNCWSISLGHFIKHKPLISEEYTLFSFSMIFEFIFFLRNSWSTPSFLNKSVEKKTWQLGFFVAKLFVKSTNFSASANACWSLAGLSRLLLMAIFLASLPRIWRSNEGEWGLTFLIFSWSWLHVYVGKSVTSRFRSLFIFFISFGWFLTLDVPSIVNWGTENTKRQPVVIKMKRDFDFTHLTTYIWSQLQC